MPNAFNLIHVYWKIYLNVLLIVFLKDQVGLADDFLSKVLSKHLKENLEKILSQQQFKAAGIGNNKKFTQNKLIRSDLIYWLDRAHNDIHENSFFDLMDEFVAYLNKTCYTGITSYEFHYAGGELCIYNKDHSQTIAPVNGKSVFFRSAELEHEVLLSHKPRMIITGWLKTN
ncbi:MAG: 2OG-Fe(II) oxygenase [Aureispira sp.]|nr:2OG-Fe(II) oxygenase [Aureispira sp.]